MNEAHALSARQLRTRVGMFVALSKGVMLLSELIIIYLAAAAPFGVAKFLRQPTSVSRSRALLRATGAALLWPLMLLSRRFVQKKFGRVEHEAATPEVSLSRELRIDDARRALLSSLYRTGDLAEEVSGLNTEATRGTVRETIASVERYVGLALAVAVADEEASSLRAPRETELCRLSGRTGDDLHIAGLCHRRRNVARLRAHQSDSRLELLHAFAELREVFESTHAAHAMDAPAAVPARRLFAALLETYTRAFELLSLFEDERAAAKIARLLDGVRPRVLRIESLSPAATAPQSLIQTDTKGNVIGDESCTTSIAQANPQTQLSRTQTIRAHG
jgi:hypothetical protein